MDIRGNLFKIFQENKDQYILYEKTVAMVEKLIEEAKGEENAIFYNLTTELLNSINNAGWEDRHSKQLQFLWDIQRKISDKYEGNFGVMLPY